MHCFRHLQSSLSFIPYSCCRNETECFQSVTPLMLSHQRLNVAIIDKKFINEGGCMEKLVQECRHVIYLIVSAIIISFVIHVSQHFECWYITFWYFSCASLPDSDCGFATMFVFLQTRICNDGRRTWRAGWNVLHWKGAIRRM